MKVRRFTNKTRKTTTINGNLTISDSEKPVDFELCLSWDEEDDGPLLDGTSTYLAGWTDISFERCVAEFSNGQLLLYLIVPVYQGEKIHTADALNQWIKKHVEKDWKDIPHLLSETQYYSWGFITPVYDFNSNEITFIMIQPR